jgi:biopolymer transport protein ExbB/TolQ
VLTPTTVDEVIGRIYATADDPRQFVLFNRLMIALSNLRNLGQVSDVDDILRSQAENDEASMETSYHLLQGLIWAIPVLGFIGTVLGLSNAIGSFGGVLEQTSEFANLKDSLRQVTAGLSEAFETTLHGLVAAMIIQLWMTVLKVAEESFLDACSEYGLRNVVGRLRLNPYDRHEA